MTKLLGIVGLIHLITITGFAQYGGGGTGGGTSAGSPATGGAAVGGSAGALVLNNNYHLGFERPEAWGLKYFASSTLLSGLTPPRPEDWRAGSIAIGFEVGWLPELDAGQQRIGFNGRAPQDLNKAPIFARPVLRVGLPDKFTALIAVPPPFEVFGVTTHMAAFGLERPLVERNGWTLGWRGYGQLGSVKGAFTCPQSVLAFAPGSPENPTRCTGESADVASLRYAGSEFQLSHALPGRPRIIPHAAVGGNFIDGVFQVHAPVVNAMDETRLWTRGGTLSTSGGITYLATSRASFTVDVFYSPLWVTRSPGALRTNDGLFNVRALLNYTIR